MLTSDKKVVQLVIDQCYLHGVRHVVISPGSRNAPFSISFDEHPDIKTFVIHDERSAAFFAMGIAEQLQEPVAICCTSGSAALNYYPAIAEAYYRSIPLIVITADRPAEWINQGDGQTIMQQNVFGKHVRYQVNLDDAHFSAEQQWKFQRETALAFNSALSSWKGPIHFNVGLSEPLYNSIEKEDYFGRKIESIPTIIDWNDEFKTFIRKEMLNKKVMVLCGQLPKSVELQESLSEFAKRENVAVLVDNTSNLTDDAFNHCIDRSLQGLNDEDKEELSPDLLITVGGAIVSKNIKLFLRKNPPKQHWKIGYNFPGMDTYQCLSHEMQSHPSAFFNSLNKLDPPSTPSNYGRNWKLIDINKQERVNNFNITSNTLSDITVFQTILKFLPNTSILHMGNSSVVRYCQLFEPNKTIEYRCNRGTSGIDGSTSTAIGAAFINPEKEHVLLCGDLSFFYDSNALWNKYLPKNLKIIVVNNHGGGIFRIIPGPSNSKQLETFFEAKHIQNIEKIASAFNCDYSIIQEKEELKKDIITFLTKKSENLSLMEIVTDSDQNPLSLQDFLTFITH